MRLQEYGTLISWKYQFYSLSKKKVLSDLWGRDSEIISTVKKKETQIKVNKAIRDYSAF